MGAEIALAVVLLVGGSLMAPAFQALVNTAANLDRASPLSIRRRARHLYSRTPLPHAAP
ncbi:MAG TPA: hypothetical protein VHW24_11655 [Bryobacteraceae bacterium]|nr:hypothetical protein [Bryobacteraceae bacterium]